MLSGSSPTNKLDFEKLLDNFSRGTRRQKRSLVDEIEARSEDLASMSFSVLKPFDPEGDDWAAGWILQVLRRSQPEALSTLLSSSKNGWFKTYSQVGIDYSPLQQDLLFERFEEADRFTSAVLRKLAGTQAESRGYVYFTEVLPMPGIDLVTIDRLWIAYSQGRFGFSVQANLLSAFNDRYDRLWPRIGWKKDGVWTRYPAVFDWSIKAPEGHMPLINQLRGVRLMDALLNHPALVERR